MSAAYPIFDDAVLVVGALCASYGPLHGNEGKEVVGVQPARSREFVAGRALVREGLGALGARVTEIPVGPGGEPILPQGYCGSISHAGAHVVALVARESTFASVGVDLDDDRPLGERASRDITIGGIAASVDLRGCWSEVRDQGQRMSCLACASSDAHAHAHRLAHALSAEYLFYAGVMRMPGRRPEHGLTFDAAHAALEVDGQPSEAEWPYQLRDADPWHPPAATQRWFGSLEVSGHDADDVASKLKSGYPVVLGVVMTAGFRQVQQTPHIVSPSGPAAGGHAVLAVGVGRRPSSKADDLFLIRNSWGPHWGLGGHAWLPFEYLSDKLVGFRTLAPITVK